MAQSIRQRNLFAAEDFKVVYDSFKQANFQAYDYDTIRGALIDYIQQNYPENFNDWIQSSEFVALIETLSFLAHSLAFRVDLAGRENFLSTAERRTSVLRIADFLGYTPARHLPSRGLLKITSVRSTQNVYDINGTTLKNIDIDFEDSYQNFLLVMNEVLNANNKFGRPTNTTRIGTIKTDIYKTNITSNNAVTFGFTGKVNGTSAPFEVHSSKIDKSSNVITETDPDPLSSFDLVYQNDSQGLSSENTGFFAGFKQGSLKFTDINAAQAVSNLIVDINAANVNNTDVWVQGINDAGEIQDSWLEIDSGFGAGTVFNNIRQDIRKLFTVKTQDRDNINIQFGDGVFSEIPRGIIRTWYRTGINQHYVLAPEDLGTVTFSFDYNGRDGNVYKVKFDAELQAPVNNASAQESITSVKQNAGRVFAAQDRMITAEDYSVYPLTVSENVKKVKAINRTYSGHSRFIKSHDPTAQYQNVNMVGQDGYLYDSPVLFRNTINLPTTLTNEQIFEKVIDEAIKNPEVINLFYSKYTPTSVSFTTEAISFEWQQITSGYNGSTGYFTKNSVIERVGETATTDMVEARPGSIVEFIETPYNVGTIGVIGTTLTITDGGTGYTGLPTVIIRGTGTGATAVVETLSGNSIASVKITNGGVGYQNPVEVEISGGGGTGATVLATATTAIRTWARVVDVALDGLGTSDTSGNPTGFTSRGQGAVVLSKVIPNTARVSRIFPAYNTVFTVDEKAAIIDQIAFKNTFGIRFDTATNAWIVVEAGNLPTSATDSSDNFDLTFAGNTSNSQLDASWLIRANYSSEEWRIISRRTRYVFGSDEDLRFFNQNNKRKFNVDTNKPERDRITISSINTLPDGSQYPLGEDINLFAYKYFAETDGYTDDRKIIVTLADLDNDNYPDNPMAFTTIVSNETINLTTVTEDGFTYTVRGDTGTAVSGREFMTFVWRRISASNYRIDPSLSNIIDVFVLNQNYDNKYKKWIADDRRESTQPAVPTEIELEKQFSSITSKKAVSDSIIYRAAEYKIIFGELAEIELQGKFKVVKVTGTTLTDNEIKTRILAAIDEFFNLDNWDFGESFYFTELSAYIHQQLQGVVSSVVIVPTQQNSQFGELFQITPNSNELFLPDVVLSDIEIVNTLTINTLT